MVSAAAQTEDECAMLVRRKPARATVRERSFSSHCGEVRGRVRRLGFILTPVGSNERVLTPGCGGERRAGARVEAGTRAGGSRGVPGQVTGGGEGLVGLQGWWVCGDWVGEAGKREES